MVMQKNERHEALLSIVREGPVLRQSELAEKLGERGFPVTQASVSRDLEELGIAKHAGVYVLAKAAEFVSEFGNVRLDTAGDCLIVGKCAPGLASAITVQIDSSGISDIVGTIAGDDTIFIAVRDRESQASVLRVLNAFLGGASPNN